MAIVVTRAFRSRAVSPNSIRFLEQKLFYKKSEMEGSSARVGQLLRLDHAKSQIRRLSAQIRPRHRVFRRNGWFARTRG
jgi:hypothetical protein